MQGQAHHVERSKLFVAFAIALWCGEYHKGKQVSGETVMETLRWCAGCMVKHGFADPHRTDPGQHYLDQ
jgi:hypothetical protein